jgi:hypothetical protein
MRWAVTGLRLPVATHPRRLPQAPGRHPAACYGCPHRGRPPRRARRRGPLKIYAHCIDGLANAKQRTTDAPSTIDTSPNPGSEEDGDSKKAS